MSTFYPYSCQHVTDEDIQVVSEALRRPHLTQGPEVDAFEAELGAFLQAPHAVACANGTAALHLAYMAAGLGPDKGLITSPVTFLATANAARMVGAPVAFADVDPLTGNIDPDSLERALASAPFKVGAVTVVHLAGRACDMPRLRAITRAYGCLLIEDACHAIGAWYDDGDGGRAPVGACRHSDLACFSFHAIKHVVTGEGGAVTTADPRMNDAMRRLRCHGMERDPARMTAPPAEDSPWYYEMAEFGYNYRIPDVLCALGRSQLRRLPHSLERRRALAARYDRLLAGMPGLRCPAPRDFPERHAWHIYPVAIDFAALGTTRGAVMNALKAKGIGTQVHYIPLYRQPYYRALGAVELPGAERYYAGTLSIPMYPQLTDADQDIIAAALAEVLTP